MVLFYSTVIANAFFSLSLEFITINTQYDCQIWTEQEQQHRHAKEDGEDPWVPNPADN